MKLVSLKELLDEAKIKNKAICAINVSNMESIMAVLEVANRKQEPIIVQVSPIQIKNQKITYKQIVKMIKVFGQDLDVITSIHLDHAVTVEECIFAINAGFNSVMYDGSLGDYAENIKNTKEVVEYAKKYNVSVEAELGKVGGIEGEVDSDNTLLLTSPDKVIDFIGKTNIDCLAVSIGNAHGFYKANPKLDFERLEEINSVSSVPLVLHGGTGIPTEDIVKSIKLGIKKINYFTEIDSIFVRGFVEAYQNDSKIYMMNAQEYARGQMMKAIEEKINIVNKSWGEL